MTREEMNDIKETASEFILGLFSLSSLVLKVLGLVESFKQGKKNEKNNNLVEETKN